MIPSGPLGPGIRDTYLRRRVYHTLLLLQPGARHVTITVTSERYKSLKEFLSSGPLNRKYFP